MTDVIVVGSYVQDLAFVTEQFPEVGETRIGSFRTGPGGKGFNQAVAAHRQRAQTLFIGAIGKDIFGEGVKQFAESEKLRAEFEELDTSPTGAASIVVNEKAENLIVVSLGASDHLSPEHVRKFRDEIAGASVVLTQAECNLEATREVMRLGRSLGVTTIFNPAPINKGVTAADISMADIVTPNETEFLFLAETVLGKKVDREFWNLPDEQIHEICCLCGVPTVVLTLGENGCFVSHNRKACGVEKTSYRITDSEDCYRVRALSVEPVDTTGAGDAFSGGLAAGLSRRPDDFRWVISYANTVAGLSTLREGTSPAMPSLEEVEAKLPEVIERAA